MLQCRPAFRQAVPLEATSLWWCCSSFCLIYFLFSRDPTGLCYNTRHAFGQAVPLGATSYDDVAVVFSEYIFCMHAYATTTKFLIVFTRCRIMWNTTTFVLYLPHCNERLWCHMFYFIFVILYIDDEIQFVYRMGTLTSFVRINQTSSIFEKDELKTFGSCYNSSQCTSNEFKTDLKYHIGAQDWAIGRLVQHWLSFERHNIFRKASTYMKAFLYINLFESITNVDFMRDRRWSADRDTLDHAGDDLRLSHSRLRKPKRLVCKPDKSRPVLNLNVAFSRQTCVCAVINWRSSLC